MLKHNNISMKKCLLLSIILSFSLLSISCKSNIDLQKDEAQEVMDDYVERANTFNEQFEYDEKPIRPRRELLQFTYGPESLDNNAFLEYLVLSNAQLPNNVISDLLEKESEYENEDLSNNLGLIREEIENYKDVIKVYKTFTQQKTIINLYNSNLQSTLRSIIKSPGLQVISDELYVSGQYNDSLYAIIKSISQTNNLYVYFSSDYKTLYLTRNFPVNEGMHIVDWSFAENPEAVQIDLNVISDLIDQIGNNSESIASYINNENLASTVFGKNIIRRLMIRGENINNLRQLKLVASNHRNELIDRADRQIEDSSTTTISIFEDNLINGNEKVIEKFAVYHDSPNAMFKKLKAFTVFNKCDVADLSKDEDGNPTSESLANENDKSTQNKKQTDPATIGNLKIIDDSVQGNMQPNTAVNGNRKIVDKEKLTSQNSSQDLLEESDSLEAKSVLGCVDFIAEDYGIIASGSILDVMLVEKFLVDQDHPVKQVMIETFILEVNSNWKNEVESQISGAKDEGDDSDGLYSFASGLLNFATATSGGGITTNVKLGGSNNISWLVNLIETNAIGRKISNPVILVKDGETGIVDKTRTLRSRSSTSVTNASTTTTEEGTIDSYEAPLKLTITPQINQHNDVIDLDFNFIEEKYDTTEPTSASTSNIITTKLKIEPGEVVMMAGLFQQTKSKTTEGIPGLMGLDGTFSPFAALFGGGSVRDADEGSELLVFINPTVITKENIGKTITRARY